MSTATTEAGEPFTLPSRHLELREQARQVAERFAPRHREVRLSGLEKSELHPALWSEISSRGWPGLLVPAAYGGSEGGLLAYAVVLEELAAANLVLWPPVLDSAIAHAIIQVGPDSARSIASASSHAIDFCSGEPRRRIDTERSADSFLPTTKSNGIFASECSRTL